MKKGGGVRTLPKPTGAQGKWKQTVGGGFAHTGHHQNQKIGGEEGRTKGAERVGNYKFWA